MTTKAIRREQGKPLYVESFPDGSGFAFNPEEPRGVKYLNQSSMGLLQSLLNDFGSPPHLPREFSEQALARELAEHGLVHIDGMTRPAMNYHKVRTLSTWFHIVNACNLSCSYCYIPKLNKSASQKAIVTNQMSTDIAVSTLEQLVDYCAAEGFQRLQVKFAGGEPTLNRPVVEAVCRASLDLSQRFGIAVDLRMLTNGVFDHAEWIPLIKNYHIGVSISVDGAAQDHDRRRFLVLRAEATTHREFDADHRAQGRRVGTWRTVDQTISALINEGVKPYLLCTVDECNFKNLDAFVEYCQQRKLGFRLSPVRNSRDYARPGLQAEMAESLGCLYDRIGMCYPINMPIERFARFAEWNLDVPKRLACGTCSSMLAVDQKGGLSSCQMRMNVPFGTSQTEAVREVFSRIRSAPENYWLIVPEAKTGDCDACDWRFSCAGGCAEHTRQIFGTVNHASPWCGLFKMLMPRYLRAVARQIKRAIDTQDNVGRVRVLQDYVTRIRGETLPDYNHV